MTTQVIICCGSGGVGKTTVSAALALKHALAGERVAVLTIDPARRLADALSIGAIGNTAVRVPIEALDPATGGHLDAMMLDAKATFDGLVRRYSPSEEAAERVLRNRYYRFASGRLGGSHEYMAMEKLLELVQLGTYDTVVLDTPPTRHALDFLRAPDRMSGLMDQGVLRWLVMPATKGGWRALELGSEAVARVLKRVLGRSTVEEIAEFFDAFRDLWEGFRDRSLTVAALLRAPQTRFLLVSSPAPGARDEALFFLGVLGERGMPFGGFLINRVLPSPQHSLQPEMVPTNGPLPPDRWQSVRAAVLKAPSLRAKMADAHHQSIQALRAAGPVGAPCWQIPDQPVAPSDLPGLRDLGTHLPDGR